MPAAISDAIKSRVIQQRLQGMSRDAIARANNISQGAVSNILKEWMSKLGKYDAEAILEMVKGMKSSGLSPAECANGLRMMNMLMQQGIDVNNSDLEEFINNKIVENRDLDDRRQAMNQEISNATKRHMELERSCNLILMERNRATEEMNFFLEAKKELGKHALSVSKDIPELAKVVKAISEYDYDVQKVLAKFEDLRYQEGKAREQEVEIHEAQLYLEWLERQKAIIINETNRHSFNLSVYDELDRLGIGANQLRILLHTVQEIAKENEISPWLTGSKFIRDIETQYDPKLGFESEIERLEIKTQVLKEKRDGMLKSVSAMPFIGPTVAGLYQRGLSEKEILRLGEFFHGVLSRTFSARDLTRTMVNTINLMTTTMTNTSNPNTQEEYQRNIKILDRAKTDLEKLNFPN